MYFYSWYVVIRSFMTDIFWVMAVDQVIDASYTGCNKIMNDILDKVTNKTSSKPFINETISHECWFFPIWGQDYDQSKGSRQLALSHVVLLVFNSPLF